MSKCKKVTYSTKSSAKKRLKQLRSKKGNNIKSAYRCIECKLFHLTHFPHNVSLKIDQLIRSGKS